ncbi:hypothetical protein FEM48_Zijuj03G0001300 [Ziziphus jujuba var. spinosa]|uniref:Uncharacterized protein n=1 Tax=Ziziphus jujuba var. spinosa TaxID=714518 RepID=A0A978VM18_ZIZJJ|nr:hypothetical protein FEM48_Zijuj03G0001300 [Ziziphus jujuba var. spinosa]
MAVALTVERSPLLARIVGDGWERGRCDGYLADENCFEVGDGVERASNVFGEPVTNETVRKYFPNKQVITRKERAYLAYNLREAERKNEKADAYALKLLREKYSDGIATLVTIYNAIGDTLTYVKEHDFSGHIGEPTYLRQIQNGQWAAFIHVVGSFVLFCTVATTMMKVVEKSMSG